MLINAHLKISSIFITAHLKLGDHAPSTHMQPVVTLLQVGQCWELTTLDLRGNALTSLPDELGRCTSLEFLHVGGNKIVEFGEVVCGGLVNLREAYLYRNKLELLPPQVCWGTYVSQPEHASFVVAYGRLFRWESHRPLKQLSCGK